MDEKKKGRNVLIVFGIIMFLIMVAFTISKENEQSSFNSENSNNQSTTETYRGRYSTEYNDAFSGEGTKVLYIGRPTCSVCTRFTPLMNYLSEKYNFTYYYMNTDEVSSDELKAVLDKVGRDINDFGTPYVVFLENGEKKEDIPGYIAEESLFGKLQEHGIIDSSETYVASSSSSSSGSSSSSDDSQYTNISFIDYKKYDEIYQSGKKSIVVLGQTGCGACNAYKPIIDEIAKEEGITIHYVDMRQLNDDEPSKLLGSLSYFDNVESWGTPLTLIIENKKVVADQKGHNDKETTLEFFKTNGLLK